MKSKKIIALITMAALSAALCAGCTSTSQTASEDQPAAEAVVEEVDTQAEAVEDAEESTQSVEAEEEQDTSADAEAEVEATAAGLTGEAANTWEEIQKYGTNASGYSVLSYSIQADSLVDAGDFWQVAVTLNKPVQAPDEDAIAEGDEITVTINDLTGETRTMTYTGDNMYTDDDYSDIYSFIEDDGNRYFYEYSDDRIDSPFYNGMICIRKDATMGVAILSESGPVDIEKLQSGNFYNGVKFDENGFVTELTFFGD